MRDVATVLGGVAAILLAGCAMSSGVQSYGSDTYTLSEHRAPILGGAAKARQDALTAANQYCQSVGGTFTPLSGQEGGAGLYGPENFTMTFRCVKTSSYETAAAQAQAASAECESKRLAGELKTHVEEVNCANPRIRAAWTGANYPFMDLIDQILAHRLLVAEQLDHKKLTEGEAQVELTAFISKMVEEGQRRALAAQEVSSRVRAEAATAQAAGAVANAAEAQAEAARVNAWAGLAAAASQASNPRPAITCTTFGPTTTCR